MCSGLDDNVIPLAHQRSLIGRSFERATAYDGNNVSLVSFIVFLNVSMEMLILTFIS